MRKIFLLFSFFAVTEILLFVSIFYFFSFSYSQSNNRLSTDRRNPIAFAALPSLGNELQDQIIQKDARIEIVRQFFNRHNSPLEAYASTVVEEADAYGIDFRLLPAIAMQESNLCKRSPPDSHNCWGFGIYGQKVTRFENFEEAIRAVTKTLALKYKADGLDTPYEIMRRYTPQSRGSWADGVEYFMSQLQ